MSSIKLSFHTEYRNIDHAAHPAKPSHCECIYESESLRSVAADKIERMFG